MGAVSALDDAMRYSTLMMQWQTLMKLGERGCMMQWDKEMMKENEKLGHSTSYN